MSLSTSFLYFPVSYFFSVDRADHIIEMVNQCSPTVRYRKFDTPFRTYSIYEKEFMSELPLTVNSLRKEEMKHHGKPGNSLGGIQHISNLIRICICYTSWRLGTQSVAPTLPGFQGLNCCIQYLSSHTHKLIFYPSNYYVGSNFIRLTWIGNKLEDFRTHNCLECHQNVVHARIINRRRSVSWIIHTLIGVSVWCKVQIQPDLASDSTDR